MMFLIPTGKLFDWIRASGKIRLITLRRIFNTVGFLMPLICNFALPLLPKEV
jgi:hypothetical protein